MSDRDVFTSQPPLLTAEDIPTWKTVLLGQCSTGREYYNKLSGQGFFVDTWAETIFKSLERPFKVSSAPTALDLALVTWDALIGNADMEISEIFERANDVGLQKCPEEVIPVIRLAFREQPPKSVYLVMTDIMENLHSLTLGMCCLCTDFYGPVQSRLRLGIDSVGVSHVSSIRYRSGMVFVKGPKNLAY